MLQGEFAALMSMLVTDNGQDPSIQEGKQQKEFISLSYENQLKEYGRYSTVEPNLQSMCGYRNILCADKLSKYTKKASILKRNRNKKHEIQLLNFSKGQMFGEIGTILGNSLEKDHPLYDLAQEIKKSFSQNFTIQIKCLSAQAQIIRIRESEFMSRIMSLHTVARKINQNLQKKLEGYMQKSIFRY